MKAPAFWYRPAGHAAQILDPLAQIFRTGTALRKLIARPYQAQVPVICVGNVVAGGSGKTPTALALAALLQKRGHKPVFVTRGYGGTQKGPLLVNPQHHYAEDVGDEALLLTRKAPVWIGRDRTAAIQQAEKTATHIILDDGLQNPNIKPDLALLVMDGAVGLGNGHVMPAGPLRENLADALQRSDAVLIVGDGMETTTFGKPILRASLRAVILENFPRHEKFFAFAGIGRPEKFYALCRKEGLNVIATKNFADHHVFSREELQKLEQKAHKLGARLLMTEKDFVRLPLEHRTRISTFAVNLQFVDEAAVEKLLYSTTASNLPS